MPRAARIDIPGLLHHVIVRGINRADIFCGEDDKALFTERLAKLLVATDTDCLAWSLMTNHFHLLLRPRTTKLAVLMRRLLTGYAVVFNLRHHRSGHLFQNRYKSIACQEDTYLLELVRYIHLNPLRAGLVGSLDDLDAYAWSGHAVLMGNASLDGQQSDEILQMFARKRQIARQKYRRFIADGVAMGKRNELVGGGLRRSRKFDGAEGFEAYDERILGSGDFVEQLWKESGADGAPESVMPIPELAREIARIFDVELTALLQGSRRKELVDARGALCFIATRKMGMSGVVVAKALNISRSGVLVAARRGEEICAKFPELQKLAGSNQPNHLRPL